MDSLPETKVQLYQSLFRAPTDVCATRWENAKEGRAGWVLAVAGGWWKGSSRDETNFLPLTPASIASHLRGDSHIGFYPLLKNNTCWWVAADFDGAAAMMDALSYVKAARFRGIPAALEISPSGGGAHVWIFFTAPVTGERARQLGTGLNHVALKKAEHLIRQLRKSFGHSIVTGWQGWKAHFDYLIRLMSMYPLP
ncbi:hypothetical protein [Arthrobacter sp. BF1]|uniref:TOTE conflict system archaeo-eukaryotic primase domain-containing protein n=1 Tax=Arthrobacter sp. BF1 TaxID=2821145 RepID=UPI001C4EDF3E|nr:hypothetical protein [Arthrobacter sp. BF1]